MTSVVCINKTFFISVMVDIEPSCLSTYLHLSFSIIYFLYGVVDVRGEIDDILLSQVPNPSSES